MAEAVGLVLGVLGLFPLCVDGYKLVEEALTVTKHLEDEYHSFYMEQGSFIRWGEIWELDSADKARKSKLQSYLNEETKIGPHVVHTLGKMSAVFADTAKLAEKYGVQAKDTKKMEQFKTTDVIDGKELISIGQKLDSEEVEKKFKKKCEKQRERLGVMKSMKFAIKDKEKFQKMIAQLREFNWWLIRNCSAEDARNLEWSIIDIVFAIDDPAILRRFCKVAAAGAWQAGKINSNQRCRVVYEKLQDIADFKANMSEAKPAPTYSYDDFSIEPRYSFKEGRATLAKFYKLSEPRIVLIEWRDASTTDRNELTKLAAIMYGKRPIDVRVPYSYGLVMPSSRSQGRYGLILEPPAHIREFEEPKLEEGLVRYRMPITLSRMLLRTDGSKDIMELGTRFRLAKALVESVHTMHTCGWVHKNIRSESIIFFPPLSSTGSGPPKELPRQYDFDRPLLTGMDRARTDEPAERPDYNYDDEDYRANDIVLDIYQHPDKRENRLRRYQRAYDIYSLGCVLLEIGLWQSLETFRSLDDSPQQFRDRILGEAAHLKGTAGAIYCNAVQECLRVDSAKCEAENQKRLCWKIAAEMDKCVA